MKLQQYDGQVQTSEDVVSGEFSIATNRKAFEVLSGGIYSDKIRAVIRELSTNAADAHIDGKQSRPFVVHLPNTMEPFFSVQDFGTGLTDKEIHSLYTTYFASSRTRSNDFTGALGLGSKSPFAYADQFTVISTKNGRKRTYTCFVGPNGVPKVSLLQEEKANEPNGIEVKLAVKTKDFDEFEEKAAAVLHWFSPRPEVVGSVNFAWCEVKYLIKNELFGLTTDSRNVSNIVMGNVAYQLNPHDVHNIDYSEQTLLQWGVDIWVGIGDVEVAASREKLGYTTATVKLIKDKLGKIGDKLREEANKFLDRASTVWEARRMIHDYKKGVMGGFLDKHNLGWKDQKISDVVYLDRYFNPPIMAELAYKGRVHANSTVPSLRKNPVNNVAADGTPIIVDDLRTGGYKRVSHFMATGNHNRVYILSDSRKPFTTKDEISDSDDVGDEPDKLKPIEDSGLYETAVMSSALPEAPKLPRTKLDGIRCSYTRLMKFNPAPKTTDKGSYWSNAKVNIYDGGVYLVMHRFGIITGGQRDLPQKAGYDRSYRDPASCASAVALLETLDEAPEVYGIRTADSARLKDVGGWVTLREHITSYVKNTIDDMKPRLARALSCAKVEPYHGYLKLKRSDFSDDSLFGKFFDALHSAKKDNESKEVKAYMQLLMWLERPPEKEVKAKDAKALTLAFNRIKQIYPLLDLVSAYSIDTKTSLHLTEYITLIDERRVRDEEDEVEIFDGEEATA